MGKENTGCRKTVVRRPTIQNATFYSKVKVFNIPQNLYKYTIEATDHDADGEKSDFSFLNPKKGHQRSINSRMGLLLNFIRLNPGTCLKEPQMQQIGQRVSFLLGERENQVFFLLYHQKFSMHTSH